MIAVHAMTIWSMRTPPRAEVPPCLAAGRMTIYHVRAVTTKLDNFLFHIVGCFSIHGNYLGMESKTPNAHREYIYLSHSYLSIN